MEKIKANKLNYLVITGIMFLIGLKAHSQLPEFSLKANPSTEEKITVKSKIFNEDRTILISLPDDYQSTKSSYPVIYFTDGTPMRLHLIRGMVEFMNSRGLMPNAILVGIVHVNRSKELTPNDPQQWNFYTHERVTIENCGGADQLFEFINQELFPLIENNYRTVSSRIFVGWSYGGLFGLYSMLKKPDMFNGQIAVDPSYWWNREALADSLISYVEANPSFTQSLFLSRRTDFYVPQFTELQQVSKKSQNFKYTLYALPEEEDHVTAIVLTLYKGLPKLFESYKIDNDWSFEEFKKFCSTSVLGYSYTPSESAINSFGYKKLAQKQYDDAIAVFKFNVEKFPESANAYDSLAEAYMSDGNTQLAIEYYEKSLQLNPQNANATIQLKKLKGNN